MTGQPLTLNIEEIEKEFRVIIYNECIDLIKKISTKYKLDKEELIHSYFPVDEKELLKKKRGRKKKINVNFINAHSDIIDGKRVLIDEDNIVYNNNIHNPLIIGKMNALGKIESI